MSLDYRMKSRLSRMSLVSLKMSNLNVFSPSSSVSSEEYTTNFGMVNTTVEGHNRRIVYEIINNIFDERAGLREDASSSECSSILKKRSDYSFDERLKYWKDVLKDRKKIADNIKSQTGKKPQDILFNRLTTLDDRDKRTIQRIIDYADRMNPIEVMNKHAARLKAYDDDNTCLHVNEILETLPKAEQDRAKIVEISGLPEVAKREMLGRKKDQGEEKKYLWLKSKVLEQRIGERRDDIERVLEFYPDIENLQIVGESLTKTSIKHNADIEAISHAQIREISSDTSIYDNECKGDGPKLFEEEEEIFDYALKVNDYVFKAPIKRSARSLDIEIRFECEPFQEVIKRILHLENIGKKVLNFDWIRRPYYERGSNFLLQATDEEFVFDTKRFRLTAGEVREIIVKFQPRTVNIVKEKWLLKIDQQFFCRKIDTVNVKLGGRCRPASEYVEKLNRKQHNVLRKSNLAMTRSFNSNIASITPLIKPHEIVCPYQRTLDERELFEFYNAGYICERYHDLELLKDIYKRVKKPRERAWDLKLDTLKDMIMRMQAAEQRALLFAEMMGVLEEMKGTPIELEVKLEDNPERDHARLLYVRGIVGTGIDEWEEMAMTLEEAFLKPAVQKYYEQLTEEEEDEQAAEQVEMDESKGPDLLVLNENELRDILVKSVRRRKAFRDAIYIQTYTHLCNIIEDIVSVIESTEII